MLDLRQDASAAMLRCAGPDHGPSRGASAERLVLVVDDDACTREAVVAGLERSGFAVFEAANGAAALDVLRRGFVPRVIVLDLMMPVMDGAEFRRRQLADPALAAIPVVVVSADARASRLAGTPGVHAVLVKPVDLDDLLHAIERASGR